MKLPKAAFTAIKDYILGKKYDLSVAIVGESEIKKLNKIYRNISKPTDILSFPLETNQGEIYICPQESEKEAKKFDRDFHNFILFLFIHGCVHLKGHDHGSTMERIEADARKKFGV